MIYDVKIVWLDDHTISCVFVFVGAMPAWLQAHLDGQWDAKASAFDDHIFYFFDTEEEYRSAFTAEGADEFIITKQYGTADPNAFPGWRQG